MEEKIGKITWSPDYKSDLEDKIKKFSTIKFNSKQIEQLLDAVFDIDTKDKTRAALREKFKKILGL